MRFLVLFVFALQINFSLSQCANNGQNPSSAFPACGTQTFNQGTVPKCEPGRQMAVPSNICGGGTGLDDINPFYYKFTCYVAGTLEFLITPNNINDDYDWQLHDVTGKSPNTVYTDPTTFVACNWSGETGITGTNNTASLANGCSGVGIPLITRAPNLIVGHEYLLMVSHFTSTNQSGYTLSFSAASANLITDQNVPSLKSIYSNCNSKEVSIKLNKRILCNSIANNRSDFRIAGTTITGVAGVGCNTSFDTDSIILVLAANTPQNRYLLQVQQGTDGNTLKDNCNNEMSINDTLGFNINDKPNADFTYTTINETCKADTLLFTHIANNNVNSWFWTFDGNITTSNNPSQQVVYNDFTNRVVKLVVSNSICKDSITKNIAITNRNLTAIINTTRDTTCPNNSQTYSNASLGSISSYFWDFDNGEIFTIPNPPSPTYPILPNNKIYNTKLIVTNSLGCKDSVIRKILVWGTVPTIFDSIIPPTCAANEVKIYFKQDMNCGSVATDGSDFSITGIAPNSIIGASIFCPNGVGKIVTLQLSQPLQTGNYNIALKRGTDGNTIINDCGIETAATTVSFNAFGKINPAFTHIIKYGCKADTITFMHQSNNLSKNWQWSFLNGLPNINTSNIQNPTVIFSNVIDSHKVQLVVDNGVCFDTSIQLIGIINHTTKAGFSSVDTTCGGAITLFTDTSKVFINKWNWQFGNFANSQLQNPQNVIFPFANEHKSYKVVQVVTSLVNCIDSVSKNIIVKPSSPANFLKTEYDLCGTDSIIIYFNAPMLCNTLATDGSDFTITGPKTITIKNAYIVDCNNEQGRKVVLKFNNRISTNGTYTLNLIKGSDGNTLLNDCNIETPLSSTGFLAFSKTDATFSYKNALNCLADTISLEHSNTNNTTKWNWFVNGVLQNTTSSFYLAYNANASYNVKLITYNNICTDTFEQQITVVFDRVKANFVADKDIVCPTENVVFTNLSEGNINSVEWSFGDGTISNSFIAPTKIYPLPSNRTNPSTGSSVLTGDNFMPYTIRLKVGNKKNCFDETEMKLKVTSNCLIKIPSAFTPNGDGLNDFLYPLNAYKAINLNFRVYNRLGRLVFETTDINSRWNGNNYSRERQPAGTYVWTLDYTDKDSGQKISTKGTTVLIR
jgi:gliding motility-associated-like protein